VRWPLDLLRKEITYREATEIVSRRLVFGNTQHIEAVRLISLVEEAKKAVAAYDGCAGCSSDLEVRCSECNGTGIDDDEEDALCKNCEDGYVECDQCDGTGWPRFNWDAMTLSQALDVMHDYAVMAD